MRISDWSSEVCSSDLPFGVDENVRDILNVANLVHAPPDLQQRVIFGGSGVGRMEQQDVAEARAPARGNLPVLALCIVNDGRAGPAQQRGDNTPEPFTAAVRRDVHDLLRPVVGKIAAAVATKDSNRALETDEVGRPQGRVELVKKMEI